MKNLLKSEIYGSMNSTWMHCSRKTGSKVTGTVHAQCMNSRTCGGGGGERVKKKKKLKTQT